MVLRLPQLSDDVSPRTFWRQKVQRIRIKDDQA
jgi:hypothetical protein